MIWPLLLPIKLQTNGSVDDAHDEEMQTSTPDVAAAGLACFAPAAAAAAAAALVAERWRGARSGRRDGDAGGRAAGLPRPQGAIGKTNKKTLERA